MGKRRSVRQILGVKTEAKRKVGKLRSNIEDDNKNYFKEIECANVDYIQLV
jgi:hypothetical protein